MVPAKSYVSSGRRAAGESLSCLCGFARGRKACAELPRGHAGGVSIVRYQGEGRVPQGVSRRAVSGQASKASNSDIETPTPPSSLTGFARHVGAHLLPPFVRSPRVLTAAPRLFLLNFCD